MKRTSTSARAMSGAVAVRARRRLSLQERQLLRTALTLVPVVALIEALTQLDEQVRALERARGRCRAVFDAGRDATVLLTPAREALAVIQVVPDLFTVAAEQSAGRPSAALAANLRATAVDPRDGVEHVARMAAGRLVVRINDLLDISRTQAGKLEPRRESLAQGAVLARVTEAFRPQLAAK
jgi:signal transduction histidine kinase